MLALSLALVALPQSVRVLTPQERAALESQPPPRPAGERLAALAGELVPAFFEREPWLAYERRYPWPDPTGYADLGTRGTQAWKETLRQFSRRLNQIPEEELEHGAQVAYRASVSWIRAQQYLVESRSVERWDPVAYVARVEEVLRALMRSGYLPPAARITATVAALQAIPEAWANAERSLVSPARPWTNEAVSRLVDLGLLLEGDLGAALEDIRLPPAVRKRFEKALQQALESTDRFRLWLLEEASSRGSDALPFGRAAWEGLVQTVAGVDLDSRALKTRLLRELAAYDRRLAGRPAPQPDPEHLVKRTVGIQRSITQASALAAQLAADAGLFTIGRTLSQKTRLGVLPKRGRSRPGRLASLWPAGKAGLALEVELPSSTWSPDARRTRARRLSAHGQAVLGLRYGWAGEALFRQNAGLAGSPVARYLWNRATLEGFGLYALDWLLRVDWTANPFAEDQGLHAEIDRVLRLETIRLLAALELHAEGLPLDAATENFRRRSGFDRQTAREEVLATTHDPLRGVGYLGFLEMKRLEDGLAREVTPADALSETLATLLSAPHLRPADHRRGDERPR